MEKVEDAWYVERNIPPGQVREWLEKLRSRQRPSLFTEEQWRETVRRWRTGKPKLPNRGNTGLRCRSCGGELRRFYVTTDRGALKRAGEDPRVRKLISGYICWICPETYFMDDLNIKQK